MAAVAGWDLRAFVQTGSGKTPAFGLALATQRLTGSGRIDPAGIPLAPVALRPATGPADAPAAWFHAKVGAQFLPRLPRTARDEIPQPY